MPAQPSPSDGVVYVVMSRDDWPEGVFTGAEAMQQHFGNDPETLGYEVLPYKLDTPQWSKDD